MTTNDSKVCKLIREILSTSLMKRYGEYKSWNPRLLKIKLLLLTSVMLWNSLKIVFESIDHFKLIWAPNRGDKEKGVDFNKANDNLILKIPFFLIKSDRHYCILVGNSTKVKTHACGNRKLFIPHCSLEVINDTQFLNHFFFVNCFSCVQGEDPNHWWLLKTYDEIAKNLKEIVCLIIEFKGS